MKIKNKVIMSVIFLLGIINIIEYDSNAYAEYRVYQYIVSPYKSTDNFSYIVLSTLDPTSYYYYHGGFAAIKIDLLRTWVCPGYTGYTNYCDSPYEDFLKKPTNKSGVNIESK
ncbi:MAG: hypothetical protein HQK49_19175 [Oligoflexia bacterium]|nr:hypothetical protein [Oligoflexia bacterium]